MLHFGAGKIPPPDSDSPPGNNSPSTTNVGHRSTSRGSSHQSVPTSPGAAGTPNSDQSAATIVVMPSTLCQPVMLASPDDVHHTQSHSSDHHHHQPRPSPPNLACVLGPPLLPPPSVSTSMSSMIGHHNSHQHPFMRYPGYPPDLVGRADQHLLRGIYSDNRIPRPDPGGGMGGTEM
jgi:hypothetical protein